MSSLQSSEGTQVNEGAEAFSKLESEIGELVRRDTTAPRLQQGNDDELNVGSLVQKVSGASGQEVEKLIAELQTLRGKLQNEAARVQREIVGYAVLLQDARKSIETILDSLSWKKGRGH
jgi:predicted  nucleic acid-binding Zn-ribbon protein